MGAVLVKTPHTAMNPAGMSYTPPIALAGEFVELPGPLVERYAPRLAIVSTSRARNRPSESSASRARVKLSRPGPELKTPPPRWPPHRPLRPGARAAYSTRTHSGY